MEKEYLVDQNISWKAKGMLAYLLYCNENATINELIKHSKDRITSVYSGLSELKQAGYLKRFPVRNEMGRFQKYQNKPTGKKPE